MRQRFRKTSALGQRRAQIIVCIGRIGTQLQDPAVITNGIVEILQLLQRSGVFQQGIGISGVYF
jgi:hypothetical protein